MAQLDPKRADSAVHPDSQAVAATAGGDTIGVSPGGTYRANALFVRNADIVVHTVTLDNGTVVTVPAGERRIIPIKNAAHRVTYDAVTNVTVTPLVI